MFLYVCHVAYVGPGWDYAETWMAFSELLHGSDCYNPKGFTDFRVMVLDLLSLTTV